MKVPWLFPISVLLPLLTTGFLGAEGSSSSGMVIWKEFDLSAHPGMFPCPGDLDGDGRMDVLLYRQGPQTTPAYLVAVGFDGRTLWTRGDASIDSHAVDGYGKEPALRGAALVYDIDQDGTSEVITEFWEDDVPQLLILDGATGKVERRAPSPFDLEVRGGRRSRCHPVARIAHLEGAKGPPALILKFEASNFVPCVAVALDTRLRSLWRVNASPHAMGHIVSVGDVDGDGRDEVALGTLLVDDDGSRLWEKKVSRHADATAIAELGGPAGLEVLLSICSTGPAYCLTSKGDVLWEKTRDEVPHGQGIWAGNFLEDEEGQEVIVLRSGHVGDFITLRGKDGVRLAAFRHSTVYRGYPDFPQVVNWTGRDVQSLWIPVDRRVVDGRGRTVAGLGELEKHVTEALRWGTTKSTLAVQAIPLDLCGDEREELLLYQPYRGKAIIIVTQEGSTKAAKPYVHQRNAYNLRTYF